MQHRQHHGQSILFQSHRDATRVGQRRCIDERLHFVGTGDVGLLEQGLPAEGCRQLLAAGDIDVRNNDLRPFLHEQLDCCSPDAAGATGNDCDLSC